MLTETIGGTTYTYTYDKVGNILTANGHTYTYGNSVWKDLLTAYDNESIAYDNAGNPTSYYNGTRWTFGWDGRELTSAAGNGNTISYAYDESGMRTSKTVGSTTYTYLYSGGRLLREIAKSGSGETIIMDFFYDSAGQPYAFTYNNTTYYYVLNLQGDVVRIVDSSGAEIAAYSYNAWGELLNTDTTSAANAAIAEKNPIRYRGYVYDSETGFYYLQSRYYDPGIGRFINADSYTSTGQGLLGNNMFAYCKNQPVSLADTKGRASEKASEDEEQDDEFGIVGGGVQLEVSGSVSGVSISLGIEIIIFWDTKECDEAGKPIVAVYFYGDVGLNVDLGKLWRKVDEIVELLTESADLLQMDGTNALEALISNLDFSNLNFEFSFSISLFAVLANKNFANTRSYTKGFQTASVTVGPVKSSVAWSDCCRTIGLGYTRSFGSPSKSIPFGISRGVAYYFQLYSSND